MCFVAETKSKKRLEPKMPVTVELKYEYFLTWPGRVKLIEVVSSSFLN